jgi:chromosome segregation ATPase
LEKKAASTLELTNTVLTQRTQLDEALNEAESARHEVDSGLSSADTRKAAFEAQILELEQSIRTSTRAQEDIRRRIDTATSASAQLQQDLMLEFHKVSDDARRKEDELLQRNVSAAANLRSRESVARSEQAAHSRELSDAEAEINRMKAAIVSESGAINTWHARIAAAKLAHAEANEQS